MLLNVVCVGGLSVCVVDVLGVVLFCLICDA